MKTFTIKSRLAKHTDSAEKTVVGIPTESVSTIISNSSYSSEDKFKGRITIAELLTLEPSPDDEDMYLVYSDDTYDDEGNFILYGEEYKNGTFVMWMIDCWRPLSNDVAEATIQGDNDLPIDVVFPENPQDNRVPSTKCVDDRIHILFDLIRECIYRFSDYVRKSSLAKTLEEYCTLDYLKENYATRSLIELAFSLTVAKKDLDSEVGALGYIKSADTSDLLKRDGSNGTSAGVSALINKLSSATSTPKDEDYYVCQYAGGGTTTTTYYRRPMSSLWKWIKAKTDAEYKPTKWTPFVASSTAPAGAMVIIGTITHTPSSNKSWQITIRMLGKHGGSYYGDTTVRLAGVDSSTQVNIKEISFVAGSISVPTVRAYRVSDTEIAIGVSKNNSWTGMDCIIENLNETDFVTSTAQETNSYNASYLLACNSMPYGNPNDILTDKNCVEKLASHGIGRYVLVFRIYGDYARYQYEILRYHGVTLDTSRTSSSSTKPNLDLCVTIDGMDDENDYCDFLEKHQLHLSYSGETNNGEFKQVEALGSVIVRTVNSDSFLHIRFGSNAFITDRQVTVSLAFEHMAAW